MELSERIFYAGIEEFRDHGIKFTMDGLAFRLGISKRTLYETVPSKARIVELVIERIFTDIREQQKKILENSEYSIQEKIRKMMLVVPIFSDLIDYRQAVEIGKAYPELYKKVRINIERDWDEILRLMQQGMEEGIIKPHSLILMKEMLCLVFERLLDGRFLIKNGITYEKAREEVTAIIFDGILVLS